MGRDVGLEDLKDVHPEVYVSLKKLLAYDGNVEELSLFFQVHDATLDLIRRGLVCAWLGLSTVREFRCRWLVAMQVEQEGDFGDANVVTDLVKDGGEVAVTNENRQQYVDAYVQHLLCKSVERQSKAFSKGFKKVCMNLPRSREP
jgi:hypothetical protein